MLHRGLISQVICSCSLSLLSAQTVQERVSSCSRIFNQASLPPSFGSEAGDRLSMSVNVDFDRLIYLAKSKRATPFRSSHLVILSAISFGLLASPATSVRCAGCCATWLFPGYLLLLVPHHQAQDLRAPPIQIKVPVFLGVAPRHLEVYFSFLLLL